MNIENAKTEFTKYIGKYDIENPKVRRKYDHSLRVMEKAGMIATAIGLDQEKIELAKLIGLLHDIGKFEQAKIYDSPENYESIDHGDLGSQILKESEYIRKYIEDNKYDNIILTAVKNHNKFETEKGLTGDEMLFTKIVRDADKWDILYEGVAIFWMTEEEIKEVEEAKITKEYFDEFQKRMPLDRRKVTTKADSILNFIALIFDINFEYTCQKIKEAGYINQILDKFDFIDKKQMEKAKIIANEYLEKE